MTEKRKPGWAFWTAVMLLAIAPIGCSMPVCEVCGKPATFHIADGGKSGAGPHHFCDEHVKPPATGQDPGKQ